MEQFDAGLREKERWLVLNKTDALDTKAVSQIRKQMVDDLNWSNPVYAISSATGQGCDPLLNDLMSRLIEINETVDTGHPAEQEDMQ